MNASSFSFSSHILRISELTHFSVHYSFKTLLLKVESGEQHWCHLEFGKMQVIGPFPRLMPEPVSQKEIPAYLVAREKTLCRSLKLMRENHLRHPG